MCMHTRVIITARKGSFSRTEYFVIEWQCNHAAAINHPNVKSAEAEFVAKGWDIVNIGFRDC